MTPREIAAVRASYGRIEPFRELAANLFRSRLARMHPGVAYRLQAIRGNRRIDIMGALARALVLLDDREAFASYVRDLATGGGAAVSASDVGALGDAMNWMFAHYLGAAFDDRLEAAWIAFFRAAAQAVRATESDRVAA